MAGPRGAIGTVEVAGLDSGYGVRMSRVQIRLAETVTPCGLPRLMGCLPALRLSTSSLPASERFLQRRTSTVPTANSY